MISRFEEALFTILKGKSSDKEKTKQLDLVLKSISTINKIQNEVQQKQISLLQEKGIFIKTYDDSFLKTIQEGFLSIALSIAAENGDVLCVKLLIEAGAKNNFDERKGETPLMIAVSRGHEECVKLIAKMNDNLIFSRNGMSALTIAINLNRMNCVKILLDAKVDVNTKVVHEGNSLTPLMFAACGDQVEMIKFLCQEGADIHTKDNDAPWGKTALGYALDDRSLNAINILLTLGAKFDVPTDGIRGCDDLAQLLEILNYHNSDPSLVLECAVLTEEFLLSLDSSFPRDHYLSGVQAVIKKNEPWVNIFIKERIIDYFNQSEIFLNFPTVLFKILADYAAPGRKLAEHSLFYTQSAFKRKEEMANVTNNKHARLS